jgi:ABC-type uncharacterized transport system fused permease/ATPase subunit
VIARELPRTTIVSIGHRETLTAFHTRALRMQTRPGVPSTLSEAAVQSPLYTRGRERWDRRASREIAST